MPGSDTLQPRLQYLLDCYYHQSWAHEVGSQDETRLWRHFLKEEGGKGDPVLRAEVDALLAAGPEAAHRRLLEADCAGRHWAGPEDAVAWLRQLAAFLR